MKGFFIFIAFMFMPPAMADQELRRGPLALKSIPGPTTALDLALEKLSLRCSDRVHINDFYDGEEGSRFFWRPSDMYGDCKDEMDALVRTKEPIDERLLQMAIKGKELSERYRAAWILIQRRNKKVISILDKMADSPSAEERYLAWHAYTKAIRERRLAAPESFDAALTHCRNEKNQFTRAQIMHFLGACKAKEAVSFLTASLDEDSSYAAVEALGEIRDPKTVPAILQRTKKETRNRHVYFHVLGQIGTPEAVDYLIEHLEEGCFAAEALFDSGSPKALPALEMLLDRLKRMEKQDDLHFAVAQVSVLRLRHKDPREYLITLAEDRKQSQWMRTHALEALGHYDKNPYAGRILKLYRTDTDDWMRMFYIRLLRDLPGKEITEAMIEHALTDDENKYHHSHYDLLQALDHRLKTSFQSMHALVEYLQHERAGKKK